MPSRQTSKTALSTDFDLFWRSVSHLQLQYHCCTFHITMENASSMKMPLLSNSKRKLITKRNMCFHTCQIIALDYITQVLH